MYLVMPIVCLSFVGKTNEPMFVHTNDGVDESESLQVGLVSFLISVILTFYSFIALFTVLWI